MEALDVVMGATLLHHLEELQLVLLPLVICHLGVLHPQQALVTIHQAFPWVDHHHHLQPGVLLLVLYHHLQEVGVHHHPCHIGTG